MAKSITVLTEACQMTSMGLFKIQQILIATMMEKRFLLMMLIACVTTSSAQTKAFKANGVFFSMVYVEGGSFMMGAPANDTECDNNCRPAHKVTLSSYYIGKYEVSQRLWEAVMGSNPSTYRSSIPKIIDAPVHDVTWFDCQKFISELNKLTGKQFRLPTEAEWEFAARGGKKSKGYKYSGSNDLEAVAWYDGETPSDIGSIGEYRFRQSNELAIYDMTGNVDEWCQDWYGPYRKTAQVNPKGPNTGTSRVLRGGSYISSNKNWKVWERMKDTPYYSSRRLGLRLVLSAK